MKSRRDALRTLAAGAALPVLHGQHQHVEAPAEAHLAPKPPKHFEATEFAFLALVVDEIIPRSETPGASEAGVPHYIDRAVGARPALAEPLHTGLGKLRQSGFAETGQDQRIAMLRNLESKQDAFFKLIKDLTIDGYYSSREGLVTELGYHGRTYLAEFPGCTHTGHMDGTDAN